MKRLVNLLGVTLLEIMLVLAIAALIIVMSVRYFQSASISQQATSFLSQLQAIAAAENSVSQGTGSYVGDSSLSGIIPTNGLATPWGGTLSVTGGAGVFSVTTSIAMPTGVCTLITGQLLTKGTGDGKGNWSVSDATCGTITYSINPSAS